VKSNADSKELRFVRENSLNNFEMKSDDRSYILWGFVIIKVTHLREVFGIIISFSKVSFS
jgi:hypothetical protein